MVLKLGFVAADRVNRSESGVGALVLTAEVEE